MAPSVENANAAATVLTTQEPPLSLLWVAVALLVSSYFDSNGCSLLVIAMRKALCNVLWILSHDIFSTSHQWDR